MLKKILGLIKKSITGLRPRWIFFVFGLIVLFLVFYMAQIFWSEKKEDNANNLPEESAVEDIIVKRRLIDGAPVGEDFTEKVPMAVMVENSVEAWPVSGVSGASLVWETLAEGNITRFLVIYDGNAEVKKIGPVRSARAYFVDWAEETKSLYAHVGGSPEALDLIPDRDVYDLNEFWNGNYFWRSRDRSMPHNVYTSTELLSKAIDRRELTSKNYESWKYKKDDPLESRGDVDEFTVDFSLPLYAVTWNYDRKVNDYVRSQNNDEYEDTSNDLVRAKNVIVMETKISVIDEVGRRRIKTIGSGDMKLYRDGKIFEGKWRREDHESRTRFFDVNGNEMELDAGLTWIEVVSY